MNLLQVLKSIKSLFFERLVERFGEPQTLTLTQEQTQTQIKNKCSDSKSERDQQVENLKFDRKSMPFKTAVMFIDLILENNPRARTPKKDPADKKMADWCTELERLHRLGPVGAVENENKGYSWKEIWNIINFCQQDDFWKTNILSPGKLRKQIIKLENKMKRAENFKKDEEISILQAVYAGAKKEEEGS